MNGPPLSRGLGARHVLALASHFEVGRTVLSAEQAHRFVRVERCPRATGQFEPSVPARTFVLEDYADPVTRVRSMAALAPVGNTGLIVVVAMPTSAVDALIRQIGDRMLAFAWVPLLLCVVIVVGMTAGPELLARAQRSRREGTGRLQQGPGRG